MIDHFCEGLLKRLRERKEVYSQRLLDGSLQSLEDYRLLIGKMKGIEESENALKEHYKALYESKRIEEMERNVSSSDKVPQLY